MGRVKCSSCGTRDLPVTAGAYRCCGIVTRLMDNGYIPAPGYSPSPLRVPAPSPFKPSPDDLEAEKGWSQAEADALSASVPSRVMTKACRDCDQPFKPNNAIQVRCTPCAVETRRVVNETRRQTDIQRPTVTLMTAKLLRGAA